MRSHQRKLERTLALAKTATVRSQGQIWFQLAKYGSLSFAYFNRTFVTSPIIGTDQPTPKRPTDPF